MGKQKVETRMEGSSWRADGILAKWNESSWAGGVGLRRMSLGTRNVYGNGRCSRMKNGEEADEGWHGEWTDDERRGEAGG
ncbi:unnamed protein product [Calypogeia fissa]